MPNIQSERIDESRKFYTEFLGSEVAMDMGWIVFVWVLGAAPWLVRGAVFLLRRACSLEGVSPVQHALRYVFLSPEPNSRHLL